MLVFNGRQVVTPDSLEDITGISQYKADNTLLHEPDPSVITHVDEFLKLMRVLTGDNRYEKISFTEQEQKGECGCVRFWMQERSVE